MALGRCGEQNPSMPSPSSRMMLRKSMSLRLAAAAGPLLFTLVWMTGPLWHPNYNPLSDTVSRLALGSVGWPQTISFLCFGCLSVLLAGLLLDGSTGRVMPNAGPVLLGLFGIGVAGAGAFNIGTASDAHQLASALAFLSIIAAMLVFGWTQAQRHEGPAIVVYSLVSALVSAALLGAVLLLGSGALSAWNGLLQRLFILTWCSWLEVIALRLVLDRRSSAA